MSFRDRLDYENIINQQNNTDIINFANRNTNTPYIIDDKINGELSVYYNGKKLRTFKAIHGKYSKTFGNTFRKKVKGEKEYSVKQGDVLGIIARDNGLTLDEILKLNPQIKDPSKIYINQKINLPGFKYEHTSIDPDEATITYLDERGRIKNLEGNLTTPAGVYFTSRANKDYKGAPSFIRRTYNQVQQGSYQGIPNSIHVRSMKENANTNGCTGMSEKDLKELSQLLEGYSNVPTYILPANPNNKFQIRNGVLTFKSADIRKTPSRIPMVSNPIQQIVWENKTPEQDKIIKQFIKGLISNKGQLQKDLNINDDTYNQLAKYSLGILGVESSYGKENSWIENLGKAVLKRLGFSEVGPDYKSEFNTFKQTSDDNSIGLTQIRYKYLSDKAKQLFDKYQITKESLINDPQKAAVGTMIRLADEYINRGLNIDKAISSWNNRPGYIDRVKRADNAFTVFENYRQ